MNFFLYIISTILYLSFVHSEIKYEHVYVKQLAANRSQTINLEIIPPNSEPFTIHLEPSSLDFVASNLTIKYVKSGKISFKTPTQSRCFYDGFLGDRQLASLSICDGLQGIINIDNQTYFIEPVRERFLRKRSISEDFNAHRIYERKNFNFNSWDLSIRGRFKRSALFDRYIETLVVADHLLKAEFTSRNRDLELYILTIFSMVAKIFKHPSLGASIQVVVKEIIVLEDDEAFKTVSDIEQTLDNFCEYQATFNEDMTNHDLAVMITQQKFAADGDMTSETLGLSKLGGMCEVASSCNVNQNTGLATSVTIAHEIAHNLNADHADESCGLETIMSSELKYSEKEVCWSKCSRDAILNFLDDGNGDCLENRPLTDEITKLESNTINFFTYEEQCKLSFGENSTHCSELQSNPCDKLYCHVNDTVNCYVDAFIAENTICSSDGDKWCVKGSCVLKTFQQEPIDGGFSDWSDQWSNCTHDCDIGVQFTERTCTNPIPSNGGKYCMGDRKKFRLCNIHKCNKTHVDPLEVHKQMCTQYANTSDFLKNDQERKNFVPYFNKDKPCRLFCQQATDTIYYDLSTKLPDGTKCTPYSNNVCINGKCQIVGCDLVLNSNATEDNCGVCNGDNSTCTPHKQSMSLSFILSNGHTGLFHIPAGATNIVVKNNNILNSLAIKDLDGNYYLNGNETKIVKNKQGTINETYFDYMVTQTVESLYIKGPTSIPIKIELYHVVYKSDVSARYYLPKSGNTNSTLTPLSSNSSDNSQSPARWKVGEWSNTCGKNPCEMETRVVECSNSDGTCELSKKPAEKRACRIPPELICKSRAADILETVFKKSKELFNKLII